MKMYAHIYQQWRSGAAGVMDRGMIAASQLQQLASKPTQQHRNATFFSSRSPAPTSVKGEGLLHSLSLQWEPVNYGLRGFRAH